MEDEIKETIKFFFTPVKVEPVNGKIVLKEHHFKYCECKIGKVWTGSSKTECHGDDDFELLSQTAHEKVFWCIRGRLTIVILKSTEEELKRVDKEGDEIGSKYLNIPEGKIGKK